MSNNKTAQIATKAISLDEEQRIVHIIATTESLDRDLESISTKDIVIPVRPKGLKYAYELTGEEKTKVKVLLDHDWAIKSQAGIVDSAKLNANGELEMWLRLSKNANGQYLYDLIKEDMTDNSWSIGYSLQNATIEDGQIKNIELLEVSGVATASNRDAETLDWKSIKEEKSMTELEKKKAQLKALQDEITEAEDEAKETRKAEGEKVFKSYQEKTKGLVAEVADADHSWETEDDKWDAMRPVSDLYSALWEAWFMSTTPLEDFDKLLAEFAELVIALVKGTYDSKSAMSEELTKALDGKTVEDIKTAIDSIVGEKSVETEDKTEVEETQEEVTETQEETKTVNKETKMTEKVKEAVKTIDAPTQEVVEVKTDIKKLDKYDFAAKQFVAYVNKDTKTLAELNAEAIKSFAEDSVEAGLKATYLNTGVTADGGAIVPDARLLADVYSLLAEYSTVANDLRVITLTEGNSLNIASLIQDVIVSEVETEGGNKPVTKPVFGEDELSLREFAGIAILTKKLVRQAAINVYDILRESFARAIARKRAELALTDATSGIVNQTGVAEIEVASADGIATWAELKVAPYRVPVSAISGAKYYISRAQLEALDTETDSQGRDLDIVELDGAEGLSGRFKNGFRFAVEEELGTGDNPHVVFGSMGRFGILLRQGAVESETFDTGIVVDGADVSHNLLQQNKLAHRVAFYEAVGYPLPGAFAVSTVSGS